MEKEEVILYQPNETINLKKYTYNRHFIRKFVIKFLSLQKLKEKQYG